MTPNCNNCEFKNSSLFKNCSHDELNHINDSKCFNTYKKGQVIFHEGNRPLGLFCVFNGKVKVSRLGSDGKEQVIRLVKKGDTLGYRSLIENTKYSASAIALDDTQACFISATEFNNLIDTNVKVASDLMRMLAKVLGDTQDKLVHLAMKPVRERLAEALLLLKSTYDDKKAEHFSISISREDLSSIVGTAKETVIRFLSEFKEEGIVSTRGSEITILRADKLLQISSLYD
ncbi:MULTISPECIES: Crp/Fnr family transcriptional regulator [Arcicella]|uniref:Crp/Fnr family transcriptional regulator n=1 Tax=Arcicella aquatica TaxID=217141 RepID=A0ABU5QPH8_9BACT|nr:MULTISPECIES: Crp/Fnr family transcriptional regulator [Arcicella]MDR6560263.1 CRP-like cAMP-binding protein [Arcicella sp. BE51]MDR6810131.1 CRP-like cAMP-binding protein [Arcicella sp. BE140]MDR6821480.1 CRP-like cAMP-binding protein [Arcicella sp. BE139]MEA5258734.1 Crp/Fnr family transcriptional regulator [Arcicella aquatica]